MPLNRPAAETRALLWLLPLLPCLSGCATHHWKHHVLYSKAGTVLYAEREEVKGEEVPKGFLHPVSVSTETVRDILSQVVYKHRPLIGENEDLLLFDREDVEALAEPLQLALGALNPNERLRFLVVRDTWSSMLTGPKATSGVIFMENEGVLNIALDRIRESVTIGEGGDPADVSFPGDPTVYRRADPLIPFRGTRLHVDAKSNQKFPRWLEIELAEVKPPALPPEPTPVAPAAVVAPGTAAGAGATTSTTEASAASGDTPPAVAPKPRSTEETEEERYARLKERLETIKRLKADGVLTDEQYQEQFEKIMTEL